MPEFRITPTARPALEGASAGPSRRDGRAALRPRLFPHPPIRCRRRRLSGFGRRVGRARQLFHSGKYAECIEACVEATTGEQADEEVAPAQDPGGTGDRSGRAGDRLVRRGAGSVPAQRAAVAARARRVPRDRPPAGGGGGAGQPPRDGRRRAQALRRRRQPRRDRPGKGAAAPTPGRCWNCSSTRRRRRTRRRSSRTSPAATSRWRSSTSRLAAESFAEAAKPRRRQPRRPRRPRPRLRERPRAAPPPRSPRRSKSTRAPPRWTPLPRRRRDRPRGLSRGGVDAEGGPSGQPAPPARVGLPRGDGPPRGRQEIGAGPPDSAALQGVEDEPGGRSPHRPEAVAEVPLRRGGGLPAAGPEARRGLSPREGAALPGPAPPRARGGGLGG